MESPTWPPSFTVLRSSRSQRVRLRITPLGTLEVILPVGEAELVAARAVEAHKDWIIKNLGKAKTEEKFDLRQTVPSLIFLHGGTLALNVDWGPHSIKTRGLTGKMQECALSDVMLGLKEPLVANKLVQCAERGAQMRLVGATGARRHRAFCLWLKEYAKGYFGLHLSRLAQETGLKYSNLRVGLQKKRWGSYSVQGTISLNAKLIFLPDAELENVLLHELCHSCEMNHSAKFWALMQSFDSQSLNIDKRLRYAGRWVPRWLLF